MGLARAKLCGSTYTRYPRPYDAGSYGSARMEIEWLRSSGGQYQATMQYIQYVSNKIPRYRQDV